VEVGVNLSSRTAHVSNRAFSRTINTPPHEIPEKKLLLAFELNALLNRWTKMESEREEEGTTLSNVFTFCGIFQTRFQRQPCVGQFRSPFGVYCK